MGICFVLAVFLAVGFLGFRHSEATQQDVIAAAEAKIPYIPNEVLVKFKPATADTAVVESIDAVQGTIVTHRRRSISPGLWAENRSEYRSFLGDPDLLHIKVPATKGTEKAILELMSNPNVEYAEKNYYFHAALSGTDWFSLQWALYNDGTNSGGTADADIDAPEAWNIFTGSSDVVVAVIDTGIENTHPDLQANIWTNPGEIAGNSYDDDGNGYDDDVHGWNFVSDNNITTDDSSKSHGTHIAGIIGANGNDGDGVAGVCWNVKLMPVKNITSTGSSTIAWCISAIDYAVDNGAQIINASWKVPSNSTSLYQAIERAKASGVLYVAAAGNASLEDLYEIPAVDPPGGGGGGTPGEYGVNIDQSPRWPASYDLDNIITVLATNNEDKKSWYSYWGLYSVDLGAPGGTAASETEQTGDIWSTATGSSYRYLNGTSMAAPFVSGVAALLLGQRPSLDWWQVKTIIMKSVDNRNSLVGYCRTHGRLNAYNALVYPTPVLPEAPTNLVVTAFENGDFFDIRLTWTDNSNNESGFKIYLKSGYVFEALDTVGANVTTYWLTEVGSGSYYFYVRAFRTDGESPKTATVSVYAK